MRRSSLPNVRDNSIIAQSSARHPLPPNVSRSWSPREMRARAENRLAGSLGAREQERKVLEWCEKHNVNVIRKLPKLDSSVLASRGMNTEKFITFVDEAKTIEREERIKLRGFSKEKIIPAQLGSSPKYCKYCLRKIPRRIRHRPTFFTSPYECEYCGAPNDIGDGDRSATSSGSEDDPAPSERVKDTIRRGNPTQVIDHRTFGANCAKAEDILNVGAGEEEDDDADIFWRSEVNLNTSVEDCIDNVDAFNLSELDETQSGEVLFSAETFDGSSVDRPVQVKVAWDDDNSGHFAEISRAIATNAGVEDDCHTLSGNDRGKSPTTSEKSEELSMNSSRLNHFGQTSTEFTHKEFENSCNSSNKGSGNSNIKIVTINDEGCTSMPSRMTQSPIANRSLGMTRVALLRLSRNSRSRSNSCHRSRDSGPSSTKIRLDRSHSFEFPDSYHFLDALSPEVKSIYER